MSLRNVCALTALIVLFGFGTEGRVTDADTNAPLSDVTLVIRIEIKGLNPVHASHACIGVEIVRTNSSGRFKTNHSIAMARFEGSSLAMAYKPGYHYLGMSRDGELVVLKADSTNPSERLAEMRKIDIPTDCPNDQLRPIVSSVLMPMYNTAKDLAKTPQEWDVADGFLRVAESIQFNLEVADRNADARLKQRPPDPTRWPGT